jgi:hypothetical protein
MQLRKLSAPWNIRVGLRADFLSGLTCIAAQHVRSFTTVSVSTHGADRRISVTFAHSIISYCLDHVPESCMYFSGRHMWLFQCLQIVQRK